MEKTPVLEAKLPGCFRVWFTTRLGGDSKGVFSSLNLDPRSEDDQDAARWTFAVLGRALLLEHDPPPAWRKVRRLADLPPPGEVGLRTRRILQRCPRW